MVQTMILMWKGELISAPYVLDQVLWQYKDNEITNQRAISSDIHKGHDGR